ncbi:hypothetical protein C0Q70_07860 [Pomacea canaliculata]|uniref:DNA mismatch repair protein n=1 Tax=Pomacea canaliculata TaxID=400727 RepID=A0A2T7PG75_POMCA|nr:hypothetical protein C0Q70_07860 [Pomacea canaliculata]
MSKSQKQTPKQGNTLLSYFNKTPKKTTDVLSPKKSPNTTLLTSPKSTPKSTKKAKGTAASSTPQPQNCQPPEEIKFLCGDVVWAKLEGYPWWPSLVCNHPTTCTHTRSGKKMEVHVQFFDTPPTHAWIKSSNVKPFRGSLDKDFQKGGPFFTLNAQVRKSAEAGDKALKMTVEERLKLVVNLQPSDDEEEKCNGEDDEDMDFDSEIFDAEMSDENDDSIKENKVDESFAKKENATPKKRTRAANCAGLKPKRRKIIQPESDEEDSGDEFKPSSSDSSDEESASSGEDEDEILEPEESEPDSPIKKSKKKQKISPSDSTDKKSPPGTPKNRSPNQPSVSSTTKSKLLHFAAADSVGSSAEGTQVDASNLPHTRLDFLQPEKIKDINQKSKHDPDYDPRTLYVPSSFLNKQTPGDYAHSGFPEIAYNRYADALIQKGYKVARIEQTETPEMMAERCKQKPTKYDKVVRREVCQITTQGTRTFSPRDGDVGDSQPSYLMAICEVRAESAGTVKYGVCFVDTSIGTFHLGQFSDDRHCSRLRTVFAHHPPSQILYERGQMSHKTIQLINGQSAALKEALSSGKEFWDSDALGLTASDSYDLAVRSLGAVTWYLQYCLMDHEVLSMKKFEEYEPLDKAPVKVQTSFNTSQHCMVLDGVSLSNLEIIKNAVTGGTEGTLLEQLDTCSTPFGKRLLVQWLCAPLCQPAAINDRLDAVEALMEMQELATEATDALKKIPDLERLLSRIHSLGSLKQKSSHPAERAILYEETQYSKRKIEDFLATVGGFKVGLKISDKFTQQAKDCNSKLLRKTVLLDSKASDGGFPDITEDLAFFDNAFDHAKARKDGVIIPSKGVDKEYDKAMKDIQHLEAQLQEYLEQQRQRLGCKPFLEIRNGQHPCISRTVVSSDFIPNDTVIGTEYGCYVPAEKCCLTPVDRIFTRLGASDRIMAGESTFFVELSETSAILQHATEHSLVLMDELGRGTATYDGTAIAYAVVKELSESLHCRSLFSTHYHSLVDQFSHDENVRTGHMACMVENEDGDDPSQETITFLYKFVKGACPKSYGFNAARLASIPEEVIRCAIAKSREFELTVEHLHAIRKLWNGTCQNIKEVLQEACHVVN